MTDAQRNVAALKMKREVLEPPRIDPKYFVSETDAYVSDSLQISFQNINDYRICIKLINRYFQIRRHIGNTDAEEAQILKDLNLSSVE